MGACWGKSRLSLSKKCLSAQCLWNWTELMKVDWQTGHWMGMLSLACFPSFLFGLYRGREAVAGHYTACGVISILIGTVCPSAAIQVTPQRSGSRLRPMLPAGPMPRSATPAPREGCARTTAWAGWTGRTAG